MYGDCALPWTKVGASTGWWTRHWASGWRLATVVDRYQRCRYADKVSILNNEHSIMRSIEAKIAVKNNNLESDNFKS